MPQLKEPATVIAALALAIAIVLFLWPTPSPDWRAAHETDLAAIRAVLENDHPGAIDSNDLAFTKWLNHGVAAAQVREESITSGAAYLASLAAYTTGFRDTHLIVEPTFKREPKRWPGFIVARRGTDIVVVDRDAADQAAPPQGAIVNRCDGSDIHTLVKQRVLPCGFDQRVPANRARAVAELFLDGGNPFAPAPASCVFAIGGTEKALKLTYRKLPKDFAQRYEAALFGAAAPFGWSEPADGVVWIGLPSFDYGEKNAARLRKVVDKLASDAERVRHGRAIIFDVRGNAGGSSLWGDEIRDILWYPEDVAKYAPPDPSGVDWRASPDNRDYMLGLISEVIPKVGSQSPVGLNLTRVARGLNEAVEQKKPYWREGNPTPGPGGGLTRRRPREAKPLFPVKVIIVSNGSCASACLDFADRILQMPGTHIVGFATAGDGLYTESRSITLPSGKAVLHFPMKVYRGRPRGDMEYYEPDIAYDGPWTTAKVRQWLLMLIDDEKLDRK